jgi:hypothetical protein
VKILHRFMTWLFGRTFEEIVCDNPKLRAQRDDLVKQMMKDNPNLEDKWRR